MKKQKFELNEKTSLTAEEIVAFKEVYGKLYKIEVKDDDGESTSAQCILHQPTRQTLDAAMASSTKKNSKFNETILKNCWLAGDKSILSDDSLFLSVSSQLDQLIQFKEAQLSEL